MRHRTLRLSFVLITLNACSGTAETPDPEPVRDGGVNPPVVRDAGVDGGTEIGPDAAVDGGVADAAPRPVGLDERPANTACVAPALPGRSGLANWVLSARAGLPERSLMMFAEAPDGSWFEIYRGGEVYRVAPNGVRDDNPLLTIPASTEGELGLLGLVLHPEFPTVPHVFFYYATRPLNTWIHVDRYTVSPASGAPNTVAIDPASRRVIFEYDRGSDVPYHAAGTIHFRPNQTQHLLYVATGDADYQDTAQDPSSFNGKLLRIDVTDTSPGAVYTPQVAAIGIRNPFRWSFDRDTGDVWIGDVGDSDFEEITRIPAAALDAPTPVNLGWPIMEGFLCRVGSDPANSCGHDEPLLLPVAHYGRNLGVSVVGGYVYRGGDNPGLNGRYFFSDFFPTGGEPAWQLEANPAEDPNVIDDDYVRSIVGQEGSFVSYVEDRRGELYAVRMGGEIFELVAGMDTDPVEPLPANLSQVGCFAPDGTPLDAMIPYDVIAPLWSDGATKRRWFAVPDGASISVDDQGAFTFPIGSVLAKEFTLDGVRVETRLMMRHDNGDWRGYTYAWIDDSGNTLADAELVGRGAETRALQSGATWTYPSRGQCLTCHTQASDFVLGLEVGQLNADFTYPRTGTVANQVHTLDTVGYFDDDVTAFGTSSLAAADETLRSIDERAWSYLHSNCAGCHQPGAPGFGGRSNLPDLRFPFDGTDLADRLCGVTASADDLGLGDGALLVTPGNPGRWDDLGAGGSVMYLRMAARADLDGTRGAMPALGTDFVDPDGLGLVADWIDQLACP